MNLLWVCRKKEKPSDFLFILAFPFCSALLYFSTQHAWREPFDLFLLLSLISLSPSPLLRILPSHLTPCSALFAYPLTDQLFLMPCISSFAIGRLVPIRSSIEQYVEMSCTYLESGSLFRPLFAKQLHLSW